MNTPDETRHDNVSKGMKHWELGTVYIGKKFCVCYDHRQMPKLAFGLLTYNWER
jgi:hypothetical protein